MASLGIPARGVSPLDPTGAPAQNTPVRAASATLETDPTALLQAPTTPARPRVAVAPATASPRTLSADELTLRAIDEHLFDGGWFAISDDNKRVPGVPPGTLDNALELVGRGRVATVVGRLRPEARAVDVDLTGDMAHIAVETITDWCRARGLWFLVRASGGAGGRAHVLIVTGVHDLDLERLVSDLRTELRAPKTAIDVRTRIRPLSAPHRRRGHTPSPTHAAERLAALTSFLQPPAPPQTTSRRHSAPPPVERTPKTTVATTTPATPLPRRRRDLPAPWAAYLERGRTAAASIDRDPSQRSLIEAEATFQLVICGYTEAQAWEAITAAHPTAFTKARERGRQWWWMVWNKAAHDADTWLRERRLNTPATQVLPETQHARANLQTLWLSWPRRTRHRDYEVLWAVLERMDAREDTTLAIAERELLLHVVLDTRNTLRASLRRLSNAGALQIHRTYVPGTKDTSNTLTLGPQLQSAPRHDTGTTTSAVSLIDPQQLHTPARPPLPLRTSLGLLATHLLCSLPLDGTPGSSPSYLASAMGLLDDSRLSATPAQLRTVNKHLAVLARHGLARVDELGLWTATPFTDAPGHETHAHLEEIGLAWYRRKAEKIRNERTEFHQALDDDDRKRRWLAQREAALARSLRTQRVNQATWWHQLDPHERTQRTATRAAWFADLPDDQQATLKTTWAQRRARAGVTEQEHHHAWLTALSPTELEQRSQQHALDFALMPKYAQDQRVRALHAHRTRWNLPGPRRDLNIGHSPRQNEAFPPSQTPTPQRYHQPQLVNFDDLLHPLTATA